MTSEVKTGTVKWFNNAKGFGFIDHEGQDAFLHFSQLKMEGYKTVKAGQVVTYNIENNGSKGLSATNVKPVD